MHARPEPRRSDIEPDTHDPTAPSPGAAATPPPAGPPAPPPPASTSPAPPDASTTASTTGAARLRRVRAYVAVVLVMAASVAAVFVVLLVVTLAVPSSGGAFAGGSFTEIERALQDHGLHICHTSTDSTLRANQAVQQRQYDVAVDCEDGGAAGLDRVVVDEFTQQEDRDASVRNLEVLVRPRGEGVAYRYHRFAVYVQGQGDGDVSDRIDAALRSIGAT